MKSIAQWLFIFLLVSMTSSCKSEYAQTYIRERSFNNVYSECEMNSAIQFLPLQPEEFRAEKLISLSITNTSREAVIFPIDFNVKILNFDSKSQQWLEIKNVLQYIPYSDPFILLKPAGSDLESYSAVILKPNLPAAVVTAARVVITGNIFIDSEKTDECVGAFIDIEILP